MTSEERNLCHALMISTLPGSTPISKEEFLRRFPSCIEEGKLALRLLEEAYKGQNNEDLHCALLIGFKFGFAPEHTEVLCHLVQADWHQNHEDVVSALDDLRDPDAVEAIYHAAQWVPNYLGFDEYRALAVKAIWALGNLGDAKAERKLQTLSHSDNPILRENALSQLKRQRKDPRP